MKSFDEIFNEVMDRYNVNNWWEIFDNELFDEVIKEIVKNRNYYFCEDDDLFDLAMDNIEGFEEWYTEMCEEL